MNKSSFYFAKDVEPFAVPPEYISVVRERTSGFIAAAFAGSPTDINKAILSVLYSAYVQGLQDGYSCATQRPKNPAQD